MKVSKVKIANFRSYSDELCFEFNDLVALIGKNDIGKSSILDALDIFFNEGKGVVKLDKGDINKKCSDAENEDIRISVVFKDLPDRIIIDNSNETSLDDEYLLTQENKLEIIKVYPKAGKEKIFIKAYHPSNPNCSNLLQKKQSELQKIIDSLEIKNVDKTKNACMRKAIWKYYENCLDLKNVEIDLTKFDEKSRWDQIKRYLPIYSLFQSDRKNQDGDSEIQDPMKLATQEILKDNSIVNSLQQVAGKVTKRLQEVANETCIKLAEMNPEIAQTLRPVIPDYDSLKWLDVFKNVTISDDKDIPLNKRGSGVKRLILLNFFRAESERKLNDKSAADIIYAIEEPETSQHPDHQEKLMRALIDLSKTKHVQIILTTHSPAIVKTLNFDHLKLILDDGNSKKIIGVRPNELPYPSLNEVNFLAFSELNAEYHNELYSFIEANDWLDEYKKGKATMNYVKNVKGKNTRNINIILSEYIRHQIHHPENNNNTPYTAIQLSNSISDMRSFIKRKREEQNNCVKP